MLSKPASCTGCPLEHRGTGFSRPKGTGENGVLIIGEALGYQEALHGLPFVGDAGHQLDRCIRRSKELDKFSYFNIVACQPANNWLEGAPWESGAIAHCRQHLDAVIAQVKPKVLAPLGGVALKAQLFMQGILDSHAPKRGYVYPSPLHEGLLVVPSIHPSFVMRGNRHLEPVVAWDIARAVEVAKNGWVPPPVHYIEEPDHGTAKLFLAHARTACAAGAWLTADIETPRSGATSEDEYGQIKDSDIDRISFSFQTGYAITFPWTNEWLPYIQDLLLLPAEFLVFWNEGFDVPRLRSKGIRLGPRILDAMYMWHFLRSEMPKGLGFVTPFYSAMAEWKSLSESNPEFYSCRDSDAAITNAYGIRDNLKAEGRFDAFIKHHVDLVPVLSGMSRAGVAVDPRQRSEFRAKMVEQLKENDVAVQAAVPLQCMPIKHYKTVPKEVRCAPCKGVGSIMSIRLIEVALKKGPTMKKQKIMEPCTACAGTGLNPAEAVLGVLSNEVCYGTKVVGGETGTIVKFGNEWMLRFPFKPGSPKQVLDYIKFRGHKAPKNYKTGNPTTSADEISSLSKRYPKDPLYKVMLKSREVQKIIGQYIDGYEPDPDGRIRTTFTSKPSTWRLASEDPNVQNIRRRWELANEYRKQFIPAPGHLLVELDYRAAEAVALGYLACDKDYIDYARLGVHAILASHVLCAPIQIIRWPGTDLIMNEVEVREKVAALKKSEKSLYDKCKTIVYLSNYGGTARKILMDNPDTFKSVKETEELQELYFGTIAAGIRRWQKQTLHLAYVNGFLQNPFNYRHYFADALAWDPATKSWAKWGTDAKAALAFMPQSTVAGIIKEAMLRLWARPYLGKCLRWQIHDSLVCEMPDDKFAFDRIRMIKEEMEKPVACMGGLAIEVEAAFSRSSWGEMLSLS